MEFRAFLSLHCAKTFLLIGMKATNFPTALSEQNARAVELVKELMLKVLGREKEFSVIVRKSNQRRFMKDSTEILIPPMEVCP